MRKLTAPQRCQIVSRALGGAILAELADEYGVNRERVRQIVQYACPSFRAKPGRVRASLRQGRIEKLRISGRRNRAIPPERLSLIGKVVSLYGVKSASQIGAEFGMTRNAVIGIWGRHRRSQARAAA